MTEEMLEIAYWRLSFVEALRQAVILRMALGSPSPKRQQSLQALPEQQSVIPTAERGPVGHQRRIPVILRRDTADRSMTRGCSDESGCNRPARHQRVRQLASRQTVALG